MTTSYNYPGSELELFSHASNWKSYWSTKLGKYLGKSLLEIGAGIGGNLNYYIHSQTESVTLVEPDTKLFNQLSKKCAAYSSNVKAKAVNGDISAVAKEKQIFDSILYIDVLEHIKNDKEQLFKASKLLKPEGSIIILAPAHNFLYSPFDKSVGHYRRYCKRTLASATPYSLRLDKVFYLDSAGLILSLANRLILKQSMPSKKQIRFWDSRIIPISTILDKILNYRIGKTTIGVYKKNICEGLV